MAEGNRLLLDVLSADQFTSTHIELLNARADMFRRQNEVSRRGEALVDLYEHGRLSQEMADDITAEVPSGHDALVHASENLKTNYRRHSYLGRLAVYFWFEEPSTRTVGSFDAARDLLGLGKLGVTSAKEASSSAKGEPFADSMRTAKAHLSPYGGAVVIVRHPQEGSAQQAAEIHDFPVINAGDGQNEHPTQALLDVYTIWRRHGRLDNLHVVGGGDNRYSRTLHSLPKTLALFPNNKITFVGSEGLWVDEELELQLKNKGIECEQTEDMSVLKDADVVYWTRLQKERFGDAADPARVEAEYRKYWLDEKSIGLIPDHASVMHPLPRGQEIPEWFDDDPRAAYWDQVKNSVPLRAALLEMVLRNLYVTRR